MGLNYSVVVLVPAVEEFQLHARLRQAGAVEELPAPFGTCATLDFPLDDVLTTYLTRSLEEFGRRSGSKSETQLLKQFYPNFFPTETTGRVGCWYVDTLRGEAVDLIYVRLKAATSSMSRLLQHSPAIRKWFLEFSREVHAVAGFLDLEAEGLEFFCRSGQPISAALDEEGRAQHATEADRPFVVAIGAEYTRLIDE